MPKATEVEELDILPLGSEPGNGTVEKKDTSTDTDTDTDKKETTDNTDEAPKDDNKDTVDKDNNTDTNLEDKDKNNNDEDQENIYKSMLESSGIEFEEEEKEDLLNTETSVEGFNKVANTISERKAQNKVDAWMNQYPHAANMLQYEMNGGKPQDYMDTYFPDTNYEEMSVSEDDVSQQKSIVTANLQNQGLDQEDIDSEIKDLQDSGLLKNKAERSLKVLKKQQKNKQEEFEKKQEQLKEEKQQQYEEHYNTVSNIVKENNIEGLNVPENKQKEFLNYIFEPIDDQGNTRASQDNQQMDMNQRLLITYLNFSDTGLSELINTEAGNKKARDIMDAINKSNNSNNLKGNKGSNKTKNDDPSNIIEF